LSHDACTARTRLFVSVNGRTNFQLARDCHVLPLHAAVSLCTQPYVAWLIQSATGRIGLHTTYNPTRSPHAGTQAETVQSAKRIEQKSTTLFYTLTDNDFIFSAYKQRKLD